MKFFRISCMACCLFALMACSGDGDKDRDTDKEKADKEAAAKAAVKEEVLPICPQVAIIRDLDSLADFGGEEPSPDRFVAGAKMVSVDGSCSYVKDGIDINFDLNMTAVRGAALGGRQAGFPYFIAVVDPAGTVLNKDSLSMSFNFSSDSQTARDEQSMHIFIPLPKDKRALGPDYQVLMGFQLTKEQLERAQKRL